jgi:hypothetical protein
MQHGQQHAVCTTMFMFMLHVHGMSMLHVQVQQGRWHAA